MNEKNSKRLEPYLDWLGFGKYDCDLSSVKDIFADILIKGLEEYRKCPKQWK